MGTKPKFILLFVALIKLQKFEVTQGHFTKTIIFVVCNKLLKEKNLLNPFKSRPITLAG